MPNAPENPNRQIQPALDRKTAEIIAIRTQFTGPLPHPQILEQYEHIFPGAAERIIRMAESETNHRRGIQDRSVSADIEGMRRQFSEARVGQYCALLITLGFIGAGTYVAISGQALTGLAFSGIGIVTIVSAFIWGRTKREEDNPPQSQPKPTDRKKRKR